MHTYWLWLALHPALSEQEKGRLLRCAVDPEDLFFPDREGLWPEEMDALVRKARSSRDLRLAEQTLTQCAQTFCQTIEEAGYRSMLYFNSHVSRDLLDLKALRSYPFWFAQYRDSLDYEYRVDVWQYTETGTVPGIKGKVDIDLMFRYE